MRWKFWEPAKEPAIDPLMKLVEAVIQNQKEQSSAVFEAVKSIGEASAKQADVLNSYLKLFNTPGEPRRWELDETEETQKSLEKAGFPSDASEVEQAEWVLKHLDMVG